MDERTKTMIQDALVSHLLALAPDANPRSMYGGIVFELEVDNSKSRIGGVYAYDAHVSLEFAQGTSLNDRHGVLEGSGKFRRHVKLRALSDLEDKRCMEYLEHAIMLFRIP